MFAILLLFYNSKSGGCPSLGRPFVIWAGAWPQTISQQFKNVLFRVGHLHISDASKPEAFKSVIGVHQISLICVLGAQEDMVLAILRGTAKIAGPVGRDLQKLLSKACVAKMKF